MSRYRASFLHLIGSILVLTLVFLVISQVWYPGVLFTKTAGIQLLKIIAGVDVVIGPLITLIIFDAKKKMIKLDMAIILICQLSFLFYGFWTIYESRPAYIVFTGYSFHMVKADELDAGSLAKVTDKEFKHVPLFGPKFVGAVEPSDANARNEIAFAGLAGMGLQNLPQYFVPIQQLDQKVAEAAKSADSIPLVEATTRKYLKAYEAAHKGQPIGFLHLNDKGFTLFVVVNSKSGEVIGII